MIFPNLQSIVDKVTLPMVYKEDRLIWIHSSNGELSLKDAYLYHCTSNISSEDFRIIWHASIPPSKSMMIWRTLHNKLPTDENLDPLNVQPLQLQFGNKQPPAVPLQFFQSNLAMAWANN